MTAMQVPNRDVIPVESRTGTTTTGLGSEEIAAEFTMDWGNGVSFPFVESDDGDITGYGHQDQDAFAAGINRYDEVCNGEPGDPCWQASDIHHGWVVVRDYEMTRVTARNDQAVPVTCLWGAR